MLYIYCEDIKNSIDDRKSDLEENDAQFDVMPIIYYVLCTSILMGAFAYYNSTQQNKKKKKIIAKEYEELDRDDSRPREEIEKQKEYKQNVIKDEIEHPSEPTAKYQPVISKDNTDQSKQVNHSTTIPVAPLIDDILKNMATKPKNLNVINLSHTKSNDQNNEKKFNEDINVDKINQGSPNNEVINGNALSNELSEEELNEMDKEILQILDDVIKLNILNIDANGTVTNINEDNIKDKAAEVSKIVYEHYELIMKYANRCSEELTKYHQNILKIPSQKLKKAIEDKLVEQKIKDGEFIKEIAAMITAMFEILKVVENTLTNAFIT